MEDVSHATLTGAVMTWVRLRGETSPLAHDIRLVTARSCVSQARPAPFVTRAVRSIGPTGPCRCRHVKNDKLTISPTKRSCPRYRVFRSAVCDPVRSCERQGQSNSADGSQAPLTNSVRVLFLGASRPCRASLFIVDTWKECGKF